MYEFCCGGGERRVVQWGGNLVERVSWILTQAGVNVKLQPKSHKCSIKKSSKLKFHSTTKAETFNQDFHCSISSENFSIFSSHNHKSPRLPFLPKPSQWKHRSISFNRVVRSVRPSQTIYELIPFYLPFSWKTRKHFRPPPPNLAIMWRHTKGPTIPILNSIPLSIPFRNPHCDRQRKKEESQSDLLSRSYRVASFRREKSSLHMCAWV